MDFVYDPRMRTLACESCGWHAPDVVYRDDCEVPLCDKCYRHMPKRTDPDVVKMTKALRLKHRREFAEEIIEKLGSPRGIFIDAFPSDIRKLANKD